MAKNLFLCQSKHGQIMASLSGNIARLVFRPNINRNMGQVHLNAQMLSVLSSLDGTRNVADVSRSLNMSMSDLRAVLNRLYQNKLIIQIDSDVPLLQGDFIGFLESQLADIMGPIAEMLIRDALSQMGVTPTSVPVNRAAELIDIISSKIPMEDKKRHFRKVLLARVDQSR
jgi:hypothetical protein